MGFVVSCGDDLPTELGSNLRPAHPDSLRIVELTASLSDSVFHLPISMFNSPTGQVGSQKLYTSHLLVEFRVPTFVVDEGDTLDLDDGRFEIGFNDAAQQTFEGAMQLSLYEVALAGRYWSVDSVFTESVITSIPELQPGPPAARDTLEAFQFADPDFEIEMALDPKALVGFDSVLVGRDSLDVNVACLFDTFTVDGKGFIEFPYLSTARASNLRFVGNYRTPQNTGIEFASAPLKRLVIVQFDPNYSRGTNLVASDGHRLHSYVKFADVSTVLPESAFVHKADLILVQADRGDSIFGTGPNLGVIVPAADSLIFDEDVNEGDLAFSTSIVALPESEVALNLTGYLFDQQERDVSNRGLLLRLSNQGTKARHFEFVGPRDPDPARRPRIRIVYGMPSDFGGGDP